MLLLLAAVFVLPFALGTGLFWSGWRPAKFSNHGELLQPARPLPDSGLLTPDGQDLPTAALRGKWLLLSASTAPCDAACENDLQQMQGLHIALNKEQSRVRRVFLNTGEVDGEEVASLVKLHARFPDLVLVRPGTEAARTAWGRSFDGSGRALYLVDPLGNVMMRYADPADLRGVLKDLERLLKYSWIR
jgi:hypothetical protein